MRSGTLCLAAFVLCLPAPALACTAFLLTEGKTVIMGKSYDWSIGSGQLVVNKRGVAKRSVVFKPSEHALEWVSRHASLTFNQHGRELPVSGMNAAGLAIETLWLDGSRYPAPDARPTLNELQFVQWVLDSFSSVSELAARVTGIRVAPVYGRVHYLACDASGACASIEHLGGRLVLQRGAELPVPVLTNHAYSVALGHLRRHQGFGGREALPAAGATGSLDRFVRAADAVRRGESGAFKRSLALLESVRIGSYTKWNLVYDLGRRRATFRTTGSPKLRWLDLGGQDPSCKTPVRVLDLTADLEGDLRPALRDYTIEANRRSIQLGFRGIAGALPKGALDQLASYPDRLRCTDGRPSR